ncbi:MAG: hypothetical protein JJT88_09090 [Gammaproteobacteria bacterium]|nr:hypothetical protein [Gammaproteobacteria bacterium]
MATPTLPRPFNARPIYQGLKRALLPRPMVHRMLSAAKRATVRQQIRDRARMAGALPAPAADALNLDETQARVLFEPGQMPDAESTAQRCLAIYEEFRASGAAAALLQRNRSKPFLLSIVAGNEFADHPDLLRFAVNRPLLEAASRYLGTVPVLEGMALWWTPPNATSRSSQAWHVDELAPRQVKVIMNCLEVTEEQGPLHFIGATRSEGLRADIGHRSGRIDDEAIEARVAPREVQRTLGPAGSGVVFDSSRCLHFGSRGNVRDRLVLTFHYLPLDAPTETRYNLQLGTLPEALADLDVLQRMALGFA